MQGPEKWGRGQGNSLQDAGRDRALLLRLLEGLSKEGPLRLPKKPDGTLRVTLRNPKEL